MAFHFNQQTRAERRDKRKIQKMRMHGAGMKKLASFISGKKRK